MEDTNAILAAAAERCQEMCRAEFAMEPGFGTLGPLVPDESREAYKACWDTCWSNAQAKIDRGLALATAKVELREAGKEFGRAFAAGIEFLRGSMKEIYRAMKDRPASDACSDFCQYGMTGPPEGAFSLAEYPACYELCMDTRLDQPNSKRSAAAVAWLEEEAARLDGC